MGAEREKRANILHLKGAEKMAKEKRTAADVAAGIEAQELEAADQPLREQTKAAPVAEPEVPAAEKEPKKLYTAEEVAEIAKQAAAEAVAKAMAEVKPQVVQVMADTEKVTLRWCAPVADDNLAVFGPNGMYGTVTGKNGTVMVPKSEWSRFYDETARRLIERRWLVVLSGMTDDERAVYHCAYRKGEVLDEKAFRCAVTMGDKLLDIFDDLCTEHQEMVAKAYYDAWERGEVSADSRDLLKQLNAKNKARYAEEPKEDPRRKGMFRPVLDALNSAEAAEED
jgi:hypothetical protein